MLLYDLEVNPNRPDAMSVMGVARDLAAALGTDFAAPDWTPPASGELAAEAISVEIVDPHPVRALPRPAPAGRRGRGRVAGLDEAAADRSGDAPGQRHRRRLQLRDARAGPAQPRL